MQREEFEKLVISIQRELYHFALVLTGNESDALDLVQETCIKALKKYRSFASGTNFRAWMFKIARNTFIDLARRRKFQAPHPLETEGLQDEAFEPEVKELTDLLPDELLNAFNRLDPQSKAIVLLADMQGFSYKEISDTLDIPIGTCMSRLFRARHKIQALILENRAKAKT